jgi:hypothetical protein
MTVWRPNCTSLRKSRRNVTKQNTWVPMRILPTSTTIPTTYVIPILIPDISDQGVWKGYVKYVQIGNEIPRKPLYMEVSSS